MSENYIVSPGECLIRRACLDALGETPFDAKIRGGCDDWDLYLRLSRKFLFVNLGRIALHYRLHASNASNNEIRMQESLISVLQKMCVTEANPGRRQKWRAIYRRRGELFAWLTLKSLFEKKSRGQSWSSTAALRFLVTLSPFVPISMIRYIRVRIGSLRASKISRTNFPNPF